MLNKYLKCSVWRLAEREDIYIYIYTHVLRWQRVKHAEYEGVNKHIAPPAEHCRNSKNTTFQERGKTTGQGDAITSKEQHLSPLVAIL
jgi:hypothetical protein